MSLLAQRANPLGGEVGRVADFVAETLASLAGGPSRLAVINLPVPVVPVEALSAFDEPALMWDPPGGLSAVGIGQAAVLTASGGRRIAAIAEQAKALWQRIHIVDYPVYPDYPDAETAGAASSQTSAETSGSPAPRLYGGFAFAENAAEADIWRDFGDARFVLPRWLYARDGQRAWLSLAVETDDLPAAESEYLTRLDKFLYILESGQAVDVPAPKAAIVTVREADAASWRDQVEDIRAAIETRRCEKIVAARCSEVELSRPADPIAVLAELDRRYPDCYRFGFRFGPEAVFVGATPERLIQRAGDRIHTEALAGSIATASQSGAAKSAESVQAAARALLASSKDRSEQTVVVRAIEEVLRPLCAELDVPAEPEIRELRHVLHLETPISGTLRAPTHVLDLVAALHPTPAVGGAPTAAAMAWIAEREDQPRGWYAAPVGWFDASGQGEFAVAIRSGLLRGPHAYLYVGAGIVRDSDPDTELAETRLKQRAVLGALGIAR